MRCLDEFDVCWLTDPVNRFDWARLVLEYADDHKYNNRVASLHQALHKSPDDVNLWNELGKLLFVRSHFSEARVAYNAALAVKSDDAHTWENLGWLHDALEAPAEAEQAFEEAVKYDPNRMDVWERLSVYYYAAGRDAEAQQALHKFTSLKPLEG